MRMHPLALAESGWVWVGAGSRPAGLRTGRAIPGLRRDAALPVRQKTRQGREGGAPAMAEAGLPEWAYIQSEDGAAAGPRILKRRELHLAADIPHLVGRYTVDIDAVLSPYPAAVDRRKGYAEPGKAEAIRHYPLALR